MNSIKSFSLVVVLSFLITACSGSVPRNELQNLPSLVEVVLLDVADARLKVRLTHRNNTPREDIKLSCQLALKDFNAIEFKPIDVPNMTSYATETLDLITDMAAIPAVYNAANIPYVLDCFLFSSNFKREHLIKRSTLFKVPGTNNQFR